MTRPLFTIVLALLLAVTPVAALTLGVVYHDTDVQSTTQHLKVCSCGGEVDTVRVKNIGDLTAHYVFQIEGDTNWFRLGQDSVTLAPGDSVDVPVFTSAPCGSVGTYHYTIYVSSEYGRYRAVDKEVTTGVCESISAYLTPANRTVEPCAAAPFTLVLTNVATFTEDYTIDSSLGFPSTVTLGAGETARLDGAYQASCSEWGTVTIPVTITSVQNKLSATKTATVTVPRSYDYDISLGTVPEPVCAKVTTMIPVFVRNLEDRANTIALTTDPDGNKTSISVPAKRTVTIQTPFTPSRAGDREFSVKAVGQNGSIEKDTRLTIPVEACYGLSVTAPSSVNACAGSVYIPFTITSDGSRTQDMQLDVRSNTTTYIDTLHASVRAGEIISKTVATTVPDADRKWYVTLAASTPFAKDEATVQVNGYSTESCYAVTPTEHRFSVWTDQEVLPVIIEQTGIQPGTYTLAYNGTVLTPVEQGFTLAPGTNTVVHFKVNATGLPTGRYVDRLTLTSHGINYITDFEVQLREKGFWQHFVDECRADDGFAVCSVTSGLSLLILLATIIIAAALVSGFWTYHNPATRSKDMWNIVGGVVLIALLVLMILTAPIIPRTYTQPIGPSSPKDLQWELGEGQSTTIDLAPYFSDPDADKLTFISSPAKNLQVKITGSKAVITALDGTNETDHLVFTANDGRGGYVDSDVFSISVVPYRPVGVLEFWHRACWFLTALFLFFAVVIVLFIVGLSPMERKHKEESLVTYSDSENIGLEIDSDNHPLTLREAEILEQAKQLVHAEQSIVAQNVTMNTVNQGTVSETVFVASKGGKTFHRLTCPTARRIPKSKRLTFTTMEDATKAGYSPCKSCSSSA